MTSPRQAASEREPDSKPPFFIRLYHAADFGASLAAIQAAADHDGLARLTAADFQARVNLPLPEPGLDANDDMWVAVAPGIGVVAYADGWLTGTGPERTYRTDCFIQPDYLRRGIGRALLTRQWSRAKYIAAFLSRGLQAPVTIRLGARAWERQTGAQALFEASGLRQVRQFLEMRRELAAPLPPAEPPPGLALRLWSEQRADEAIWAAYNEAFAEHWGHQPEPYTMFSHHVDSGRFQPRSSPIAWAEAAVAGACLNEFGPGAEERLGEGLGWVHLVFVGQAWRGRGLGRALLRASLQRARELGNTSVRLIVDEENHTGALALYSGLGFETASRRRQYQRTHTAQPRPTGE